MKNILLIFLLFTSFEINCQSKERAIQLSAQTFASGVEFYPFYDGRGAYTFAGPALGMFKFDNRHRYSLIELSGFGFNEVFVNFELKNLLLGLRFERGTYLFRNNLDRPLRFRLGASFELTYTNQDRVPKGVSPFPRNDKAFTSSIAITPHLEYWAGDELYFDLAPSLTSWMFGYERSITENPSLTKRQQHRGGFILDTLGFLFRIGAGMKF